MKNSNWWTSRSCGRILIYVIDGNDLESSRNLNRACQELCDLPNGCVIPVNTRNARVTLIGVKVHRHSKKITVILRGHGVFQYRVIALDVRHIAIDFPKGVSSLKFPKLPVQHQLLEEIRIAQHPNTLRLIFTLTTRARYAIKTGSNFLAVQFRL